MIGSLVLYFVLCTLVFGLALGLRLCFDVGRWTLDIGRSTYDFDFDFFYLVKVRNTQRPKIIRIAWPCQQVEGNSIGIVGSPAGLKTTGWTGINGCSPPNSSSPFRITIRTLPYHGLSEWKWPV